MATKKRTTKTQFKIFIDALKEQPVLRTGRLGGPKEAPVEVEAVWTNLTTALNACGDGPVRTTTEWKKVFTEWKSATRKKKREHKELNDLESQLLQLTGPVVVEGLQVHEIGVAQDHMDVEEETIIIDGNIDKENQRDESTPETPETNAAGTGSRTKRVRRTTGDILTDAYVNAINSQKEGLTAISAALQDIAVAINRFCDITESKH